MRVPLTTVALWATTVFQSVSAYWMEDVAHRGVSPFNTDQSYQVFRNVKDFGAKGDGVTDDTEAINLAISSGNRCAPQLCKGNTITPAVVYFPPGTYLISNSIIDYYYTQIVGDPTDLPVIKASPDFPTDTTLGLLDGNQYGANGLAWMAVNVFFRQIRNLVIDTTAIPADKKAVGLHWPSSQATAVTNIVFRLSQESGNQHVGLFMEEGSGGLLNDLVFYGGDIGAQFGNQQYTTRNLTFIGSKTAINQLWNWGWTYKSINVIDCEVGISMQDNSTGSITLLDSTFTRVGVALDSPRNPPNSQPPAAGSMVLSNVVFDQVSTILTSPGFTLPGNPSGKINMAGFADGNVYDPEGPKLYRGSDAAYFPASPNLMVDGQYYARSKPLYESYPASSFLSIRDFGGLGDGVHDDTAALNTLFREVASNPGKVAFVDAGYYLVTDTVFIPAGAKIVGEALTSVILAYGERFADMENPYPVVQVGKAGDQGSIEWSDMVISTRGPCAGAKLIEFNLASNDEPSGMWDVHTRVGGHAGSDLQLTDCPTAATGTTDAVNPNCIAAYMSLHVTKTASNLFTENCWYWIADHDLEDPEYRRVTIFAGRGVLVESTLGRIWLSASGSEHHVLYQYQLVNTRDVYLGQAQTETPYYQPNPPASVPFTTNSRIRDPDFTDCTKSSGVACAMAWGIRIIGSQEVVIFGGGFYSFFNDYNTSCSDLGAGARCQQSIFTIDDGACRSISKVRAYNVDTIGSIEMISRSGKAVALAKDNVAGFASTLAIFKA